jgi:hypothetical protein
MHFILAEGGSYNQRSHLVAITITANQIHICAMSTYQESFSHLRFYAFRLLPSYCSFRRGLWVPAAEGLL